MSAAPLTAPVAMDPDDLALAFTLAESRADLGSDELCLIALIQGRWLYSQFRPAIVGERWAEIKREARRMRERAAEERAADRAREFPPLAKAGVNGAV